MVNVRIKLFRSTAKTKDIVHEEAISTGCNNEFFVVHYTHRRFRYPIVNIWSIEEWNPEDTLSKE